MHRGQHGLAAALLAAAWLAGCAATPASEDTSPRWVASWGSAQAVPWNEFVLADGEWNDTSLRQIVSPSLSAKRLRVRVSNVHGTAPLEISAASIGRAVRPGVPDVEAKSLQALKFLRHLDHFVCKTQNFLTCSPKIVLSQYPVRQTQVPEGKQRQTFIFVLDRVVIGFEQVFPRHVVVGIVEIPYHRIHVFRRFDKLFVRPQRNGPQDIDHQ